MDISDTLAPDSQQLDAVDLLGGERTFTISGVTKGSADQPINVELAEFPRPWRPGKSMRRVLAACWSPDASTWAGRRVTLFCDTSVRFGSVAVGGVRVKALSHIDGRKSVPLLVARGKSAVYTVEPLKDTPAPKPASPVTPEAVATCTDINQLREWQQAEPRAHDAIEQRIKQIAADAASEQDGAQQA